MKSKYASCAPTLATFQSSRIWSSAYLKARRAVGVRARQQHLVDDGSHTDSARLLQVLRIDHVKLVENTLALTGARDSIGWTRGGGQVKKLSEGDAWRSMESTICLTHTLDSDGHLLYLLEANAPQHGTHSPARPRRAHAGSR